MNILKIILAAAFALFATATLASETSPLEFVNIYIDGLIDLQRVQTEAQADLKANPNEAMANCVRASTGMQLVLQGQINIFNDMRVNATSPIDTVPADISNLYSTKLDLYKQMGDICTVFLSGPKQGVDYASMTADMPKISAKLKYIDHTLTTASEMVAAALIDQKPDSHNHLNHLVITRDERKNLVDEIKRGFGKNLNAKDQTSSASQAGVIYDFLTKQNYFCADDPWQ